MAAGRTDNEEGLNISPVKAYRRRRLDFLFINLFVPMTNELIIQRRKDNIDFYNWFSKSQ